MSIGMHLDGYLYKCLVNISVVRWVAEKVLLHLSVIYYQLALANTKG